jgi:hypothetical protein
MMNPPHVVGIIYIPITRHKLKRSGHEISGFVFGLLPDFEGPERWVAGLVTLAEDHGTLEEGQRFELLSWVFTIEVILKLFFILYILFTILNYYYLVFCFFKMI